MSNPHDKHRSRMFERLQKEGASGFHDHELLEMLLYFVIPRGDTNPTAHNLLNEFKSINGVFKAEPAMLMSVNGIGTKSAMGISIVSELYRRAIKDEEIGKSYKITNHDEAKKYCKLLFMNKQYEHFYVICLDIKGKVLDDGFVSRGTVDEVRTNIRRIMEIVLRSGAHSVVLAHNHPGGEPTPSNEDIELTQQITVALNAIGVKVNDHIIVGDKRICSLNSLGTIDKDKVNESLLAAQKQKLLQNVNYEYKGIE